jgi:hypothetical protein
LPFDEALFGHADQPRDEHGRWAEAMGLGAEGADRPAHEMTRREYTARKAQAEHDSLRGRAEKIMSGEIVAHGPRTPYPTALKAAQDHNRAANAVRAFHYDADHQAAVEKHLKGGGVLRPDVAEDYHHLLPQIGHSPGDSAMGLIKLKEHPTEKGKLVGSIKLPDGTVFQAKNGHAEPGMAKDLAVNDLAEHLRDRARERGVYGSNTDAVQEQKKAMLLLHPYSVPEGRKLTVASGTLAGADREYQIHPQWNRTRGWVYKAHSRAGDGPWEPVANTDAHKTYASAAHNLGLSGAVPPAMQAHDPDVRAGLQEREKVLAAKDAREKWQAARKEREKADRQTIKEDREQRKKEYQALASEAGKSMKGKRGEVTIKTPGGDRKVSGTVYGNFAVHKAHDDRGPRDGYTLTHVPTGLAVGHHGTAAALKVLAHTLTNHPDVNWSESDVKKLTSSRGWRGSGDKVKAWRSATGREGKFSDNDPDDESQFAAAGHARTPLGDE